MNGFEYTERISRDGTAVPSSARNRLLRRFPFKQFTPAVVPVYEYT